MQHRFLPPEKSPNVRPPLPLHERHHRCENPNRPCENPHLLCANRHPQFGNLSHPCENPHHQSENLHRHRKKYLDEKYTTRLPHPQRRTLDLHHHVIPAPPLPDPPRPQTHPISNPKTMNHDTKTSPRPADPPQDLFLAETNTVQLSPLKIVDLPTPQTNIRCPPTTIMHMTTSQPQNPCPPS